MLRNILKIWATLRGRNGTSALEYGLIAAVAMVVGMASFKLIGTSLVTVFNQFKTALAQ